MNWDKFKILTGDGRYVRIGLQNSPKRSTFRLLLNPA